MQQHPHCKRGAQVTLPSVHVALSSRGETLITLNTWSTLALLLSQHTLKKAATTSRFWVFFVPFAVTDSEGEVTLQTLLSIGRF